MSAAVTGDSALDSLVQKLYQRAHREGNENFTLDIKRARKVLTLTEQRVDQAVSLYLALESEQRDLKQMQVNGVPKFKDQVRSEPSDRPPDGHKVDETTATPEPDREGPRQSSPEQDAVVVAQLVSDINVEQEPERTGISTNQRVAAIPEEHGDIEEGPESTVTSNPQTPAHFDRLASSERMLQPEGDIGELVDEQPPERIDESRKRRLRASVLVVCVLLAIVVMVAALAPLYTRLVQLTESRDAMEPHDDTTAQPVHYVPQVNDTEPPGRVTESPDPGVCECDEGAEQLVVGGFAVSGTVLGGIIEPEIEDCGVDWTGTRPGRWFSVCGNGRTLNATTCTDDATMNDRFDSVITVWSGNFTDIWRLQCIGGNDDDKFDSCGFESGFIWNSQNNTCYYIQVVAWDANDTQPKSFGIQVKEQSLDDPVQKGPSSVCAEAISLSIESSPVSSSTIGDTPDTSLPLCGGIASKFPGRWFEVRGNGKKLYATTCTEDTSLHNKTDTLITVWSGDCPDDLLCEGGNDDYEDMDYDSCEWESLAEWDSRNDQMYYIYVQVQAFQEQKQPFAIQIIESEEQDDDDDNECFPPGATVEAKNKGYIPIEEVNLGDELRTATGFSGVYAFAMRTASKMVGYRKFTTASSHTVEMSYDNIVFIGEHMEPKLAIEVQIGDLIMCMPEKQLSEVTSVETVKKEGSIHPLTYDSTIVVDGVLVSAHYGEGFALVIKIKDYYLVNKHEFQQILFSPLRLMCRLSQEKFCGEANHYYDDGSHHYVGVIENIHAFLRPERVRHNDLVFEENFLTVSAFLPFKLLLFFCLVVITVLDYAIGLRFSSMTVVLATSLLYLIFASVKKKCKSQIKKKQD